MRGNIVAAAVVLAIGLILGCGVLVLGMRWGIGGPLDRLTAAVDRHAAAIETAGHTIAAPRVTMLGPVPVTDERPLRIQGTQGEDGSNLTVDVQLPPKKK